MQSTKRRAPMPACLMLSVLSGCSPFAGARPIVQPMPNACSSLLPESWLKGVPSADLGNGGTTVGDWIKFGDAQTGQLDKANDRYAAAIGIVQRCEIRDAAAVRRARPRVLGVF